MPTIFFSAALGLCSTAVCAAAGNISSLEGLAIYSITGTTAALMLIFLPMPQHQS